LPWRNPRRYDSYRRDALQSVQPCRSHHSYRIAVANVGTAPCRFALLFRSKAAQPKLGVAFLYQIVDATNTALITTMPPAAAPAGRLDSVIAASQVGYLEFRLVIPRGQAAAPGPGYSDTLQLELYALGDNGKLSGAVLQSAPVAVTYTVERVLSVNIKGGNSATTLDFGALAKGNQRTIAVQARSNQSYQLDVSSDNRGVLALTPAVPGQIWGIPYVASLDGQTLDLSHSVSLQTQPATRPEADASHTLVLTIGEVGQKRAGRYEDVVTISINGALP
jgi:hypothetical protein